MGRNKIKIEKIRNDRVRKVNIWYKKVTSYKRSKGLLKKSMELSILCGTKVFLCVYDKPNKMTFYTSDQETLNQFQSSLSDNGITKEYLFDADVDNYLYSIKTFSLNSQKRITQRELMKIERNLILITKEKVVR